MSEHLRFLLLGLANGAIFAALGLALVVTHRSAKVVNFATSSLALLTATLYAGLRHGELYLLIPGLPESLDLGDELAFAPAALLALAITAVFGLALYGLVFRPLRTAPPVAGAVASLGIAVVIVGLITQRLGTSGLTAEPIFPRDQVELADGVTVSQDRLWLAASVLALAVALWALNRFTRFGLASRAVSQSEKGAYLSGIPADRVAATNWVISAVVAGTAGILIAPVVPPVPIQYMLFVVPALATAALGGFDRLAPAVVGGLALGMMQSDLTYLRTQHDWIPQDGAPELLSLALILLVLVVRAKPLPGRGVLQVRTLGRAPRPRALAQPALVGAALGALGLMVLGREWRSALVTSLIFGVIALSSVVVTGYSGQISLAQLTLAGVAGFLLGPITTDWTLPLVDAHLPFPLAPLAAALGATAIGVLFALPAVRIRGLPVAVVTLALAVALEAAWFRNIDLVSSSGKDVAGPTDWLSSGIGTADYPRPAFCLLVLAVLVVVALGVARLRTSSLGAAMLAVRANERAAAAAGVDVVRTKVVAFALGAFVAGLGGSLLAYKQGNVTFDSFSAILGLSVFATVYLAGITSVSGAVAAGLLCADGLVFKLSEEYLSLGRWYTTLAGIGLVLTVVKNPEGIVAPLHELAARVRSRVGAQVDEAADLVPLPIPAGASALGGQPATLAAFVEVGEPADTRAAGPSGAGDVVLSVQELGVRYGGVVAVDGVSFDVRRGTIVGLIGPNGAGKTTLLDAVSGFTPATGHVMFGDRWLDRLRPHRRVRAGLGRTFQSIELYDDLSVVENVLVGQTAGRGRVANPDAQVGETLDLLGLGSVRDRPAGELSQGRRQLVSIARALVGRPDVLLLDEPAAGLDSTESRWLGDRLRAIRDTGTSVVLVDHDVQLVLDLCDQVHVLDFGRLVASGPPATVRDDPKVMAAYLGGLAAAAEAAAGPDVQTVPAAAKQGVPQ